MTQKCACAVNAGIKLFGNTLSPLPHVYSTDAGFYTRQMLFVIVVSSPNYATLLTSYRISVSFIFATQSTEQLLYFCDSYNQRHSSRKPITARVTRCSISSTLMPNNKVGAFLFGGTTGQALHCDSICTANVSSNTRGFTVTTCTIHKFCSGNVIA